MKIPFRHKSRKPEAWKRFVLYQEDAIITRRKPSKTVVKTVKKPKSQG